MEVVMANIVRWNPVREMIQMRDVMDRLFNEAYSGRELRTQWALPIDAYATADAIILKADVPGVKPEDLQILLEGDTLTIRGEFKNDTESKNHVIRERVVGKFERVMTVSTAIEAEKVEATFENGVLTLTLPKAETVKPRQITIKPKANHN
jgi:HSP20 family protein